MTTVLNSLSIKRNFVLHAGSYAENFATGQEILWFITMQNVEALGWIWITSGAKRRKIFSSFAHKNKQKLCYMPNFKLQYSPFLKGSCNFSWFYKIPHLLKWLNLPFIIYFLLYWCYQPKIFFGKVSFLFHVIKHGGKHFFMTEVSEKIQKLWRCMTPKNM